MSSLSFLCVCLLSLVDPQRKLLVLSTQESFFPSKRRSNVGPGWCVAASRHTSIATSNRKKKMKWSLQAHVPHWKVEDGVQKAQSTATESFFAL